MKSEEWGGSYLLLGKFFFKTFFAAHPRIIPNNNKKSV